MNEALLTVRYILAFLLLAAAGPKLADRAAFRRAVADHGVLPRSLEGPVAAAIPWLEAGSAIALFAGLAVAPVAAIDALMFLSFGAASIIDLVRGRRVECGCFGSVAPRPIGWDLVALDLVCAGMAGVIAANAVSLWMEDGARARVPSGIGPSMASFMLAGTLVVAYLLVGSWLGMRSALASADPRTGGDLQ